MTVFAAGRPNWLAGTGLPPHAATCRAAPGSAHGPSWVSGSSGDDDEWVFASRNELADDRCAWDLAGYQQAAGGLGVCQQKSGELVDAAELEHIYMGGGYHDVLVLAIGRERWANAGGLIARGLRRRGEVTAAQNGHRAAPVPA